MGTFHILSFPLDWRVHFFISQSTKSVALLIGPCKRPPALITGQRRQQYHWASPDTPTHEWMPHTAAQMQCFFLLTFYATAHSDSKNHVGDLYSPTRTSAKKTIGSDCNRLKKVWDIFISTIVFRWWVKKNSLDLHNVTHWLNWTCTAASTRGPL